MYIVNALLKNFIFHFLSQNSSKTESILMIKDNQNRKNKKRGVTQSKMKLF